MHSDLRANLERNLQTVIVAAMFLPVAIEAFYTRALADNVVAAENTATFVLAWCTVIAAFIFSYIFIEIFPERISAKHLRWSINTLRAELVCIAVLLLSFVTDAERVLGWTEMFSLASLIFLLFCMPVVVLLLCSIPGAWTSVRDMWPISRHQ